ncbi:MAG TPA: VWA domain-containing protein [Solirubrobacteraceae bacterium]|nr:VWA domain-containing protein [Solirubrobacteraceae bacterium]
MSFGSAWALAGLVLLAPLVLLHLRQRSRREREVPSLLLWHEFELESASVQRRLRPPPLPLLLALQVVALALLVVTLAQPRSSSGPEPPATVIVLDDSLWMQVPGRLADAQRVAERAIASAPAGAPVRIVLAGGDPAVLYRGDAAGARDALARVRRTSAPAGLPAALTIAGGLLSGPHDRLLLIRAPEDAAPPVHANRGELGVMTAGRPVADQGIFSPQARCGIGAAASCEVVATVRNTGSSAVTDRLVADVAGHRPVPLRVHVGPHSTATVKLFATPDQVIALRLLGSDPLAGDDRAWVAVPGDDDIPRTSVVTLVGTRTTGLAVARALAAVPGVRLRLRTPSRYRARDARASDLVVVDGAAPGSSKALRMAPPPGSGASRSPTALPPAPAAVLLDPSTLPGGRVRGPLAQPTLSGTGPAGGLLDDVDLSSLTIAAGGARVQTLPRWVTPIAWSPSGPLLAAGDDGRVRVLVSSFDPAASNLTQLGSFPVLVANIVRWALAWVPTSAVAGTAIGVDSIPGARELTLRRGATVLRRVTLGRRLATVTAPSPGLYTVTESGLGVTHRATVAVNAADGARSGTPIDLGAGRLRAPEQAGASLAPWLIAAALVVLALEWAYWSATRRRVAV